MIRITEGPVSRYGTQTAQGSITIADLAKVYNVDKYDREKGRPGEKAGYQRSAEEARITALAKSIASKGLVVINAIVLNNREPNPKKISFTNGITQIDLPKKLWALDGQHRCEAWLAIYNNPDTFGVDQKAFGKNLVNFTLLWGAGTEEEVLTFYDINHFGKSIKLENRIELDVYLTKLGISSHKDNQLIAEMDDVVEHLHGHSIWNGKIKFANSKEGIVPKSALVQSLALIFKDANLSFLSQAERKKLITAIWEGLGEVFPEILGEDSVAKDWSLQKAIGVNIFHRLIPIIYADIIRKNMTIPTKSAQKDVLSSKVWTEYFKKIRAKNDDTNILGQPVDGVQFWTTGKEGAAGSYSSGQGRSMLLEKLSNIALGESRG